MKNVRPSEENCDFAQWRAEVWWAKLCWPYRECFTRFSTLYPTVTPFEYPAKTKTEFENILICLSRGQLDKNHEKTRGRKYCDTLPLKWCQIVTTVVACAQLCKFMKGEETALLFAQQNNIDLVFFYQYFSNIK